jgi:hypothetical protein
LPLALMLIVGLALGFGAGYLYGPRFQQARVPDATDSLPTTAVSPEPAAGPERAPVAAAAPRATNAPEPTSEPTSAGGPSPAASGRLVVVTTPPGAAVTINGQPSGRAPLTKEGLSFGNYVVGVALPGYQPRNAQVRLSGGAASRTLAMQLQRESTAVASKGGTPPEAPRTQKPVPVPAAPMARPPESPAAGTGTLEIDSRPVGAQAFVDGRPVGPTPVRVPDVAAGGRVVRFELTGHRTLTEVAQVARGRTTRVARSLEPTQ